MREPKLPVGCAPAKYTVLIDMHSSAQPNGKYIKSWRKVQGNKRGGDPAKSGVDQRSQVGLTRTEYLPVVTAQDFREELTLLILLVFKKNWATVSLFGFDCRRENWDFGKTDAV
jgi:hypothetical protein